MKVKELKQYGIEREKIDNGYRVSPTYRYSIVGGYHKTDLVIEADKDNIYGDVCYVASINDNLITNFRGATLKWESLDDLQDDIYRMFMGMFPEKCYNTDR